MKLLFPSFLLCLLLFSCKKNDNGSSYGTDSSEDVVVVGRIMDGMGQPLTGVTVKTGSSTVITGVNGDFRITGSNANTTLVLSATKSGYFAGNRSLSVRKGNVHYTEIMLLEKQVVGSIPGTIGGSINLGNGSAITLQPNSVVTASTGALYTGNVDISMAWIDPTSSNIFRQMPGNLVGKDSDGNEFFLQSFGMLGVELTGSSGQKLQIAPNKKASLKFPLPTAIQASAAASIPLWSFNDTTGLWIKEGVATKNGSYYAAEVSHFSWWNCDLNLLPAFFSARFVNQSGQPLQHVPVRIKRATGTARIEFTDSTGFVQGIVPANENLVVEVLASNNCNT